MHLNVFIGCLFDGVLHNHGDTINPNCTTKCKCNQGRWECSPKKCYSDTCQAYANGHFHTFDGTAYDYQGTCEYVLVKPCSNDDFTISIVQEALKPGVVEIKRVIITNQGRNIVLQTGRDAVVVDGRRLDKYDGNMITTGEILVQWIAGYAHATFEDSGIDVFWDGESGVQVSVQNTQRRKLCGLCGFYNGKNNDDLRISGTTTTTSDVKKFALSWLRGNGNTENKCKPVPSNEVCSKKDQRNADDTCNVLKNAPFTSCHSKVAVEPYVANCKSDFCNCTRTNRVHRDTCACEVITNYVRACAQAGVSLENWIGQTRCTAKTCVGKRVYKECGTRCQLTCSNYRSPPECSKDCAEGCFCPDGQVLKGGQCVNRDTCDGEYSNYD